MTLYSYRGNYPQPIPFRIRLSDGTTKTDPSTFTEAELSDAGYILVSYRPSAENGKVVEWSSNDIDWIIRDKTQEELDAEISAQWETVRADRDSRLSETDFIVFKSYEAGVPVPEEYVIYRQELRDIPQSQTDPYNIIWPELYPES